MQRFRNNILITVSFVFFTACAPSYLSPEEMTTYLLEEENGLRKTIELNDTKIDVMYRPTDLWVHQELGDEKANPASVSLLREKYDKYLYFIVSLSRNDKEALHQISGGFGQYSNLVQTLSFWMPDYVTLTTSERDTIPVGDFMLNRTYGMSLATDVLFVFNREKAKQKDWIQFNLNEFGLEVGNQRFRFDMKDLEHAPGIYKDEIDK